MNTTLYTVAFITYLLLTAVVIGMILDSSISTYLSIIHLVATLAIIIYAHFYRKHRRKKNLPDKGIDLFKSFD